MEISVINWWQKNHQSSAHEVLHLFGFCVVPWEDFRKPSIERCMGTKIGLFQNISGTQRLAQRANGIRVECFPRIQYVAAQSRSQELIVEISWDTREFHRKDYIHVDVQRRLLWIKRQWKRMRVKCSTRFSICKEIWNRTMVISWSWIRKELVFYSR